MLQQSKYGELSYRGLMLLRRLGNGSPTLSQMEFAQSIISLLNTDSQLSQKLDEIFRTETQSRESIQRDNLHLRKFINIINALG